MAVSIYLIDDIVCLFEKLFCADLDEYATSICILPLSMFFIFNAAISQLHIYIWFVR
ncbi:MAG: hypothetical protein M3O67_09610 [Bacteroidota bacterium]|nr:hypothetical protein [Bacteroidota bacterium]